VGLTLEDEIIGVDDIDIGFWFVEMAFCDVVVDFLLFFVGPGNSVIEFMLFKVGMGERRVFSEEEKDAEGVTCDVPFFGDFV